MILVVSHPGDSRFAVAVVSDGCVVWNLVVRFLDQFRLLEDWRVLFNMAGRILLINAAITAHGTKRHPSKRIYEKRDDLKIS